MRIDAVTLATVDMSASITFYEALGFEVSSVDTDRRSRR